MAEDMAIIIPSCDKYSDLWEPFFFFFNKYWPDCPYPIYLLTNELSFEAKGVVTLRMGRDISWSSNLRKALETVRDQRILIILEDYFFTERVNGGLIEQYAMLMGQQDIAYIRLVPLPPPNLDSHYDNRLGLISKGAEYRTSLQAAIWRRDPLLYLLERTGSPWEFEIDGSKISGEIDAPFLSVKDEREAIPMRYYFTAVVQGRWMPAAIKMCKNEGAPCDHTKRPVWKETELFWKKVRRAVRIRMDVVWHKIRNGS